jgi:acyl dehydratase
MKIGDVISLKERVITQEKMSAYSGPGKNIHTDDEEARKVGLPGTIAQGLMFVNYISEMLARTFGGKWLEGGELTVSFRKIVRPGDTIRTLGKVKNVGNGKITLNVWCENEKGEIVVEGEAIVEENNL